MVEINLHTVPMVLLYKNYQIIIIFHRKTTIFSFFTDIDIVKDKLIYTKL